MNNKNIKSPAGLEYKQGIVWCTLTKYKKRLERMNDNIIEMLKPHFYEIAR